MTDSHVLYLLLPLMMALALVFFASYPPLKRAEERLSRSLSPGVPSRDKGVLHAAEDPVSGSAETTRTTVRIGHPAAVPFFDSREAALRPGGESRPLAH